jgi:hypothetical protein
MTIDLDATARDLQREKLVDRGRLKVGGRQEVRASMERAYAQHGLRSYVLLLPSGESIEDARPLWDALKLDPAKDLLLVSNGAHWEARGWGLSRGAIDAALDAATPALRQYFGKGIQQALEGLSAAATGAAAPPGGASTSKAPTAAILGGTAALAASGVAFVIWRRDKLAKERRVPFDAARASAERAFTDLVLASEELSGDDGAKLQLEAGDLKKRLDAFVAEAEKKPLALGTPVTLGKIRQFESELAALRSTRLQKARDLQCSSRESSSTSPAPKPNGAWDPSNGSDLSSEPSSISGVAKKS